MRSTGRGRIACEHAAVGRDADVEAGRNADRRPALAEHGQALAVLEQPGRTDPQVAAPRIDLAAARGLEGDQRLALDRDVERLAGRVDLPARHVRAAHIAARHGAGLDPAAVGRAAQGGGEHRENLLAESGRGGVGEVVGGRPLAVERGIHR